jgi:NTE family protein
MPKGVGLALSGGAVLGAAHVGVLEVLEQHGVRPSYVAGTSAGSVVGAVYCAGVSLRRIRLAALQLEWAQLGSVVLPRRGFLDGGRLEESIVDMIGDRTFDDLEIPFAAAATDLVSEELVILNEGRVAEAVRASCALPGVFTPIEREGGLLVDGGLINNLPVSAVREMGADYVIAVDLSAPPSGVREVPGSLFEIWFLSVATLIRNAHREASLADAVICPDVGEFSWIDIARIPTLIERGRQAAEAAVPQILRDLEEQSAG